MVHDVSPKTTDYKARYYRPGTGSPVRTASDRTCRIGHVESQVRGKRGSHPPWQRNASCLRRTVTSTWCTNRLESPWAVCCQNGGIPNGSLVRLARAERRTGGTTPKQVTAIRFVHPVAEARNASRPRPFAHQFTHVAGTDANRPDPLRYSGGGDRRHRTATCLPAPVAITDGHKPNRSCDRIDCAAMKSVGARESDSRCLPQRPRRSVIPERGDKLGAPQHAQRGAEITSPFRRELAGRRGTR